MHCPTRSLTRSEKAPMEGTPRPRLPRIQGIALAPNPGHSGISACKLATDIVSSHTGKACCAFVLLAVFQVCSRVVLKSTGLC